MHKQQNSVSEAAQQRAFLQVTNLRKAYALPHGKIDILDDINLQVQQGEFITILGPSGSGKTTLLALLGALDTPDGGEIWLDTTPVHQLKAVAAADFRRRQIGFVFQMFYLLPNLTALENVMSPLLPYRREIDFNLRERANNLLERVGLGHRTGHTPGRLSGGEQQRVAIARALINQPRVILADEPTGNLDPTTGEAVLDILRELQQTGKQTLIMVTHNPQLASGSDQQIHLGKQ
ncbi:ABC transporter ATP-binding protein [Dictyobacter vulcani]|uniref:ABC transporter ATP-binding protein n=1 Tax=Dictyobacter vulcani TaxID=2607529 RepID=A0A5J4KQJ3_9CHLR|nr:ABC transporter ATP-binding protein [Dictyobacter vulcani]GER90145.1 ABC transporter ATP-binding protein [Dictyobacter vulcani]